MDIPAPAILAALVAVLGSGGVVGALSAWLVYKSKAADDRQTLIDQLQEERDKADARADADRKEFTRQIDKLWHDKAASREHVMALRAHIWERKDPPPPSAPDGYIY